MKQAGIHPIGWLCLWPDLNQREVVMVATGVVKPHARPLADALHAEHVTVKMIRGAQILYLEYYVINATQTHRSLPYVLMGI